MKRRRKRTSRGLRGTDFQHYERAQREVTAAQSHMRRGGCDAALLAVSAAGVAVAEAQWAPLRRDTAWLHDLADNTLDQARAHAKHTCGCGGR